MAKLNSGMIWKSLTKDTKKANWDKVQELDYSQDPRYLNVYERQQLDRSKPGSNKQTPFTRNVGTWAITIGVFVVSCILIGILQWLFLEVVPSATAGDFKNFMNMDTSSSGNVPSIFSYWIPFGHKAWIWQLLLTLVISAVTYGVTHVLFMRNLRVQNMLDDPSDINQYENDQHIALPEEIMRRFDWFPDVGCKSSVQVSSLISHVALSNKGLKKIPFVVDRDKNDEEQFYDILDGNTSELHMVKAPMIDTKFGDDLFEASSVPKELRKVYDATDIPYNPGNENRDKLSGYDSVADMINGDWELPLYEPQRPGGAFLVDTAPVNTICCI